MRQSRLLFRLRPVYGLGKVKLSYRGN